MKDNRRAETNNFGPTVDTQKFRVTCFLQVLWQSLLVYPQFVNWQSAGPFFLSKIYDKYIQAGYTNKTHKDLKETCQSEFLSVYEKQIEKFLPDKSPVE